MLPRQPSDVTQTLCLLALPIDMPSETSLYDYRPKLSMVAMPVFVGSPRARVRGSIDTKSMCRYNEQGWRAEELDRRRGASIPLCQQALAQSPRGIRSHFSGVSDRGPSWLVMLSHGQPGACKSTISVKKSSKILRSRPIGRVLLTVLLHAGVSTCYDPGFNDVNQI